MRAKHRGFDQLYRLATVVLLALLAACNGTPPAQVPPTTTAVARSSSATPAPTVFRTPSATAVRPTQPASATASTATSAAAMVTGVTLAPPTATPLFPKTQLTDETFARLKFLRAVGFGTAIHAAIAPDNHLLAVATTAGVAWFALPSLSHLRFDPLESGAMHVAFSADGQSLLITLGRDFTPQGVEQRRVVDGTLVARLPNPTAFDPPTLVSPSGQFKATLNPPDNSPNPGVQVTRTTDGALIYKDDTTLQVAFSADSSLAALTSYTNKVQILAIPNGALQTLELPSFASIAFSPDAQSLITAGQTVQRWDVVAGTPSTPEEPLAFASEPGCMGLAQRIRYSADEQVLTVEGRYTFFGAMLHRGSTWWPGANLNLAWDSDAGGVGVENAMHHVGAISPAAKLTARTDDGQTLDLFPGRSFSDIRALAFSPDGTLLAVGDAQGKVELLQVADGVVRHTFQVTTGVYALEFSPDGALVGVEGLNGLITVWQLGVPRPLTQIVYGTARPANQAPSLWGKFRFTADHAWLLTWDEGFVRFYRLSDGQLLRELPASNVTDVAIGPHRRLIGLLRAGRVELWGLP
ncbi:MAG: hypothetical protein WCP31_10605 [Chloroflexales bacterium]